MFYYELFQGNTSQIRYPDGTLCAIVYNNHNSGQPVEPMVIAMVETLNKLLEEENRKETTKSNE